LAIIARIYTELKQNVLNSWYVKTMSVRTRSKRGFSPLESETKNQNFLENLMSAA